MQNYTIIQNYISHLLKILPPNQLQKCISAFNGFAIYKTSKFINCHYDGKFNLNFIPKRLLIENIRHAGKMILSDTNEDCEHRSFHFQAIHKNHAKIRISPHCLFI